MYNLWTSTLCIASIITACVPQWRAVCWCKQAMIMHKLLICIMLAMVVSCTENAFCLHLIITHSMHFLCTSLDAARLNSYNCTQSFLKFTAFSVWHTTTTKVRELASELKSILSDYYFLDMDAMHGWSTSHQSMLTCFPALLAACSRIEIAFLLTLMMILLSLVRHS